MESSTNQRLKITDLTFRDGQQSLLATRFRTDDIEPIAKALEQAGYHALEVWGGATFDTMHRFLGEDPWERLSRLRRYLAPSIQLQMLLRGQNLVGYRNYADDVVEAFVQQAAETGVDIFRVFDALNDPRNFECAGRAVLKNHKHFQAALSYTVIDGRMGGAVFTLDYWVNKARQLAALGAHSICIKDMAGLLSPDDATVLIPALKKATGLPLELHSHTTSGMAEYTMLRAIDAGVDIIDTCSAPLANRTSHPAVEPIATMLQGTPRDPGLNLAALEKIVEHLESIAPKYRNWLDQSRISVVDIGALRHQIPGGMLSNLMAQLREADAENRLAEVFAELPRVRTDLGYPPLVTPTSQMVGVQAVQNVLFGKPGSIGDRYQMISDQVKDYCYGLYGKPPAQIHPELQTLALKGYRRGEVPITCRPAETLPPELEKAKAEIGPLAKNQRELLLYTLFPTTGKRFLQVKQGIEAPPKEWAIPTATPSPTAVKALPVAPSQKLRKSRSYEVRVNGETLQVEVAALDSEEMTAPADSGRKSAVKTTATPAPGSSPAATSSLVQTGAKPGANEPTGSYKAKVIAPMPGIIIGYKVKSGDVVEAGSVVALLEAMKMENQLTSPVAGVVGELLYKPGERVTKQAVLLTII